MKEEINSLHKQQCWVLAATVKEVLWYKMWIKEVFNVNIIPTRYGDNHHPYISANTTQVTNEQNILISLTTLSVIMFVLMML
jgi:hypothetical protein